MEGPPSIRTWVSSLKVLQTVVEGYVVEGSKGEIVRRWNVPYDTDPFPRQRKGGRKSVLIFTFHQVPKVRDISVKTVTSIRGRSCLVM